MEHEHIEWAGAVFALRFPGPVCELCHEPIEVGAMTRREKYVSLAARYAHAACLTEAEQEEENAA